LLNLCFANIQIQISSDKTTADLLRRNYSGLINQSASSDLKLSYTTCFTPENNLYRIEVNGPDKETIEVDTDTDFLYFLEKSITIQSQKLRTDLFFLHSAALKFREKTILIMGQSGAGKSTTTFALTHHGFEYLSDELSPIDLNTMMVSPYTHALCLKQTPPEPYRLPENTLKTTRTMHVPVESLKGGIQLADCPVTHVFFVKYDPQQEDVLLSPVNKATASIQLYTNGLNHLCHADAGLPAATRIASHCDCYALTFSNVTQACEDIKVLLQN
jgi:hypothetical protein